MNGEGHRAHGDTELDEPLYKVLADVDLLAGGVRGLLGGLDGRELMLQTIDGRLELGNSSSRHFV